jgi:hypothetical protein
LGFPGGNCLGPAPCDVANFGAANPILTYDPVTPDNIVTFPLPTAIGSATAWNRARQEIEILPRPLCHIPAAGFLGGGPRFLGVYVRTEFDCNPSLPQQGCDVYNPVGAAYSAVNIGFPLSQTHIAVLRARTQCCRAAVAPTDGFLVGTCIDPDVQTCCGGLGFNAARQRCCNAALELVTGADGICPCSTNNDCPATHDCCLPRKYPEQLLLAVTNANFNQLIGQCYQPGIFACCDTGSIYDPGVHQCCPINGIQTVNEPCPCVNDVDCPLSAGNRFCCRQTVPALSTQVPFDQFQCTRFFNYPTGQGLADNHPVCPGRCMDLTYQICCNGALCAREYEKCCNTECCNLFHGTCLDSYQPSTTTYSHIPFASGIPYNQERTRCSLIENLHPIRAFWVFVLPSIIAAAALLAAGVIIIYACKTDAKWTAFEKVVFVVMLIQLLLGISILWSPIYRYAVLVIVGTLIEMVILAAVANVFVPPEVDRFLPSFALGFCAAGVVITQIVVLIGIINPITGNALIDTSANSPIYQNVTECSPQQCSFTPAASGPAGLGFGPSAGLLSCQPSVCRNVLRPRRNSVGLLNRDSGIWITVLNLYRREIECVQYYDYFQMDVRVLDRERNDNPEIHTFGFCSQGYLLAILILAALIVMVGLTLLGLIIAGFVYELLPQIAAPIF